MILVTGGAGYIGSITVKKLLENNKKVIIIDDLSEGSIENVKKLMKINKNNLIFVKMDLKEKIKLNEILKSYNIKTIIHLAASISVEESTIFPEKYYENNLLSTLNLVNLANRNKIKNFIFASTAAVYGIPEKNIAIKEDFHKNPINPYGMSKLFSEQIIKDVYKYNYLILRFFNVAGASKDLEFGQKMKKSTHLIKIASECAVGKRNKMYIFGTDYPTPDGTCIRDYIHIEDLTDIIIRMEELLNNCKDRELKEVFNCGYDKGISVKEVIDTMKLISKNNFEVINTKRRSGDPPCLIANTEKLRKFLNWKPKYNSIYEICKSSYEWEKKNV